jgi:hypothetical protein
MWSSSGKTVVIASINEEGNTGSIKVAGVTHQAKYQVKGFDRRWDFGLSDDFTYDYMFLITPDNQGLYYDFSVSKDGTAKPSQIFVCRADRPKAKPAPPVSSALRQSVTAVCTNEVDAKNALTCQIVDDLLLVVLDSKPSASEAETYCNSLADRVREANPDLAEQLSNITVYSKMAVKMAVCDL